MRNVRRITKPRTLQRNAERWKRLLLEEIREARRDARKPHNKFFDKYNKPEVKDALATMYGRRCCYCEAPVKVVTKGHIEHRKPKKGPNAFPELTFEWDNLHLACPTCNESKGDKWDARHEILDAVVNNPITNHLTYEIDEVGVFRSALTKQGRTTIDHADLNRDDLSNDARVRVLLGTLKVIREVKRLGNDPGALAKRHILEAKSEREYGSLIKFAIMEFLEN